MESVVEHPKRVSVVVFLVDGQRYGVDLHTVERVALMVAVSPFPKAPAIVLGAINVGGEVVPLLDIRRRFGRPSRDYGLQGQMLILQTPLRRMALPVDEVAGVEEIDPQFISPPSALPPGILYVTGVVPTANGLLFLHDIDTFLAVDEAAQLDRAVEELQS